MEAEFGEVSSPACQRTTVADHEDRREPRWRPCDHARPCSGAAGRRYRRRLHVRGKQRRLLPAGDCCERRPRPLHERGHCVPPLSDAPGVSGLGSPAGDRWPLRSRARDPDQAAHRTPVLIDLGPAGRPHGRHREGDKGDLGELGRRHAARSPHRLPPVRSDDADLRAPADAVCATAHLGRCARPPDDQSHGPPRRRRDHSSVQHR